MAGIDIQGIEKSFGGVRALAKVNLTVSDGEFVALLGPSGCGKTTLLRIVAGLETASAGRVVIGGRDVSHLPPRERGLAMVFQNYAVFPHMSVFENVAFGLRMKRVAEKDVRRHVDRVAALLHIEPHLERYPAKLSGGQRQRVAVARALAVEPAVLLMDEPLSNLDALLRLEMRSELKAVLAASGTTTIYVTHDQTEAMGLADRIALMHRGMIEQIDSPQRLYERPASRFAGGFVGSPPMNFLSLPVRDGIACLEGFSTAIAIAAEHDTIVAGIRAEDIEIADRGVLPFDVAVVASLGATLLLTGRVAGQLMLVAARPDFNVAPGTRISLLPNPSRIVWIYPLTNGTLA